MVMHFQGRMNHLATRNTTWRNAILAVAIVMICVGEVAGKFTPYAKAITLEYVPYLIFQKWKLTNYRRNEPIYQLKCLGGCEFEPVLDINEQLLRAAAFQSDWVKCHNVPAPTERGPAWRCHSDLPSHLQFSTLEVVCEGYESRDDEYILDGSCGLEYSLKHISLPAPNLEVSHVVDSHVEITESQIESQWSGCQWLILSSVIYVCCYCLYHVVQDDLHEALAKRIRTTAACERCQHANLSMEEIQEPLKVRTQLSDIASSEPPKTESWDISQMPKSPLFHPGPFRESIFKSPTGRPPTPIGRTVQYSSSIHRLARAETQGRKSEEGGNSSGSEFSTPNSPAYKAKRTGLVTGLPERKERTSKVKPKDMSEQY